MLIKDFKRLIVFSILVSASIYQPLFAEIIEVRLPSGKLATADLRAGKPGQATVLLMHGFLQTREFQTVSRLADGIANAGFTTLSPTLSLGISRRTRSLACEAAHHHTLEQDVAEIAFWVDWLARHKPGPVIIVGHSYGSLQSLIYAANKPAATLRQVIALSLVDAERPSDARTAMLNEAKTSVAKKETGLLNYTLGYCKKYVATPQSFLSYANLQRNDILQLSRKIKVPVEVIMGGNDDRMGEGWTEKLRAAGNQVQVIEGANHFFDAEHEFDVLDAVISLLKSSGKKK